VIFHALTIFPEFFGGLLAHGVVKRAQDAGILDIRVHNLRDWTSDRHKTVDDRPFGGGEGMVLKPEPIFQAVESIWNGPCLRVLNRSGDSLSLGGPLAGESACPTSEDQPLARQGGAGAFACPANRKVALLSAQGRLFDQAMANRLSRCAEILLICGRYEGVDERVAEHLADEEIRRFRKQAALEKTARLRPDLIK